MTRAGGYAVCAHGRLDCEDCAMIAALERGAPVAAPVTVTTMPGPELAGEDLDVDLGDGRSVFVAAGDPIPAEHADRPRHPRRPAGTSDDTPAHRPTRRRKDAR